MIISSNVKNKHHLTVGGKKQVLNSAKWLINKKIDLIFVSPFMRTKETADVIAKNINLDPKNIIEDDRLREINTGIWDGKNFNDYVKAFTFANRFIEKAEGGENYTEIKNRVGDFIYDIESKYQGKNILIISHDTPLFLLETVARGLDSKQSIELRGNTDHYNQNAKPRKLDFHPLPHNSQYELDLHRPFIDDIELVSLKGNKMKRVPEVFDCWFESGSMPFGETHYPFNKHDFNPKPGPFSKILGRTKGYPADFIAEGLDQTRGWFYSMLVLGVALFGKSPFKQVVVCGLVLAEDGQKMSKSKKNYPEMYPVLDKYGADALRYVLMSSQVVHAEDFAFSEKAVDEVVKKHIGRLNNVLSFYEMYSNGEVFDIKSTHPLDIWITTRLKELTVEMTEALEKYQIDKATRPIALFIDDLSTWYIRRSRDRFKSENKMDLYNVLSTTRNSLITFAKLIAPFMPFLAEDVYQRLKGTLESVHLENWPEVSKFDIKVLENMNEIRKVASFALEARTIAKVNVRQPLARLTIRAKVSPTLFDILKDEVNVKEIIVDEKIMEEVMLDTNITPELKEEGIVREFIRSIQELRKEKGFTIKDRVNLIIDADKVLIDLVNKNKDIISSTTLLKNISFENLNSEIKSMGEYTVKMDISIV
jgi:isoleucyl-tRNA synthetase